MFPSTTGSLDFSLYALQKKEKQNVLKHIETIMLKQFNFREIIIKIIDIMNPCLPFVVKMCHERK